jgi:hypothetical protein
VKRRLVLLSVLLGLVGASAGTAFASASVDHRKPRNEVCVVLAQDDNGNVTQDYCVNWPSITNQ